MTGPLAVRVAGAIVASALLATVDAAAAGRIQIAVSIASVSVVGDQLHAQILVQNTGDEPALNLTPTVRVRGTTVSGRTLPAVDPGTAHREALTVTSAGLSGQHGGYPIVVRVAYADGSSHAFEALHVGVVHVGAGATPSPVVVTLAGGPLAERGRIETRVQAPSALDVVLSVVAPAGLTVEPATARLHLEDQNAVTIRVRATNEGITPGSVIPVFAIAEHAGPTGPQTAIATLMLTIDRSPERSPGERVLKALFVALLVTWLAMAVAALWRRVGRQRG